MTYHQELLTAGSDHDVAVPYDGGELEEAAYFRDTVELGQHILEVAKHQEAQRRLQKMREECRQPISGVELRETSVGEGDDVGDGELSILVAQQTCANVEGALQELLRRRQIQEVTMLA